jgi:DNA-binding transcriptional MerR regulator
MRPGELARLVDVSTDILRHYERLGLLARPPRTGGGYRNYPAESLERVRLIRRALGVGFSLSDLTAILKIRDQGGVPCHQVRATAHAKLRQIERQIRDLEAMRDRLRRILRAWNARLAQTPKNQRAKLLEALPQDLERRNTPARFASQQDNPTRKVSDENRNNRNTRRAARHRIRSRRAR